MTAPANLEKATRHRALTNADRNVENDAHDMVVRGREIFRFDPFGDEAFWGDTIKLHQAIEGERFGGVGPGLSPTAALALGLKIDVDALLPRTIESLKAGALGGPAVTLALLKANAVVVSDRTLRCQRPVALGGRAMCACIRGRDGGAVPYWNAFAAITQMHGKGTFYDPRLNDHVQFPVAARNHFGNIRNEPDLVSPTLPALQVYQLALLAPRVSEVDLTQKKAPPSPRRSRAGNPWHLWADMRWIPACAGMTDTFRASTRLPKKR